MPRKIMSPFTFSDGTHVPANNWVVVPQQAMMKDANNYSEPHKFNGFRFVKDVWGSVKQACPARFYVADMSKMIIAKFIMEYDIKLADEKIPDSFAWGVIRVPHPRLAFLLKKRDS
jgi:cytochrome P450